MEPAYKSHHLKFCNLQFSPTCVIIECNEGVDIRTDQVSSIIGHIREHFGEMPYAYISNRKNTYSVDPREIRRIFQETSACVAAFVTHSPQCEQVTEFERQFYKLPSRVFQNLDDALGWAGTMLPDSITENPEQTVESRGI